MYLLKIYIIYIYIYIYIIYIYIFIYIPRIHKRLHDVPGKPVISNCGTPTEKKIRNFLIRNLNP